MDNPPTCYISKVHYVFTAIPFFFCIMDEMLKCDHLNSHSVPNSFGGTIHCAAPGGPNF